MPAATLGQYGGWLAGIGVVAAIFALVAKFIAENSASTRFDACHRQIELVLNQIDEAEEERDRLDAELPLTNGSVQLRLQHAERHLAELERILPVESQRREVESEIEAAERRVKLAEEKHAAALANWKAKLRANGLPERSPPANLAIMAGQCERLAELEARIENRRDDMGRRQREFAIVSQRILTLAEETGLKREKAHLARSNSITWQPNIASRPNASPAAMNSANGPAISRSRKSTMPAPRSATSVGSTHYLKSAAWPMRRNCGNWRRGLPKPKSCARSGPPPPARLPPPSASTGPSRTSPRCSPPTSSAAWNTIGKRSPRSWNSSTVN